MTTQTTDASPDETWNNWPSDDKYYDDDQASHDFGDAEHDEAAVGHRSQASQPAPIKRQNPAVKKPKAGLTPVANASHEFIVNFGRGKTDNCPIARTLTWDELIKQFTVPDTKRGKLPLARYLRLNKEIKTEKALRDAEKNGRYFIMAKFSRAGTRDAVDVEYMTGFVGDIDSGKISKEVLQTLLAGTEYLAYSSYSHSPDMPMWRFVLPYPRPVTAAAHAKAYEFLQKVFNDQLDKRCKTPAQLWYTPACPPDAGQYYEFFTGAGDLFDPELIDDVAPTMPSTSTALVVAKPRPLKSLPTHQLERLNGALDATPADDREVWVRVGLALKQVLGSETGYSIWLRWSKKSDKFDEDDAQATWDSFKDQAPGAAVTLGTIYYYAKENGWIDVQRDMPAQVQALDDEHFMALEGGKSWVFKEDYDPELSRSVLTRMALKSFVEFFSNQTLPVPRGDGVVMIDVASLWHRHPARRSFNMVVFMPGLPTPPGCYNLWRGFPVPPIPGAWSLRQQHVLEVICNGDKQCEQYLLNWMAYAIQNPDKPGEVAIVMQGDRGTGKGKLAYMFGLLFGEHFLQVTQAKHLVGHFNAHLRNCVFLFVDEALWAGDKQGENVLKALVTETTIQIEGKGVNVITAKNRLHIMMASNNDWVVPAGSKERRYCVLQVNDTHIQDYDYFAAIDDQMLTNGGLAAMMHDLVNRDISGFNIREFVWTAALDEQILRTLDPAMLWWMDHLDTELGQWQFQSRKYLSESFAGSGGTYNEKSSDTKLGMFLNKVVPGGVKKVMHSDSTWPSDQRCYEFPPQNECRQALMKKLGLKNDRWE